MVEKNLDELSHLIAVELSLVKKGANEKKRFPIFKAKELGMDTQEILKAVLETEVKGENDLAEIVKSEKVSEKGAAAMKGALRLMVSFKDEMPEGALRKMQALTGQAKPGFSFPEGDEIPKWLEAMPAALREQIKKAAEPVKAPELPPEAQAIFKAQQDKLETVQKALKVETDKREIAEWVQKASTDLSHYPGKSMNELAVMLKSLNDVNPDLATAQFESMKAASAALKGSGLLGTAGAKGEQGVASAMGKIDALAKGLIEKAEKPMSKEQAVAKVLAAHPELYENYLAENQAQTSPTMAAK
jgi:hypothetical protein